MRTAVLFPGQGSQATGMGRDFYNLYDSARDIYAAADQVLGFPLSSLCFNGPQQDLNLTANTQPALLTTSAAIASVVRDLISLDIACVAGHSLGEYTALWFAEAIDLATAVKLVRLRGEAMQSATPEGTGAMAAVIGLDPETVEEICRETARGEVIAAANFNANGQTVISGHKSAVERAIVSAREKGARKSLLLPVSAPFHCSLMEPAARVMGSALNNAIIHPARHPVICNVTATPLDNTPEAIRSALVEQITAPVQWAASVEKMVDMKVELFLEIGPGSVLSNLVKRIAPDIRRFTISNVSDIKNFIDFYSSQN
jgi:[acyl-carrier-protein] S-malonyltransferase